jgi:Tfp pilus assembly protein PilF
VEQLLGEVLEREPNRSLAHAVMGHLRRQQGRISEAQAELEAAIALDRNDAWAIRTLGRHLGVQVNQRQQSRISKKR